MLCHDNADVDGVASAVVLSEVLSQLGARSWAGCESVSKLAGQVLSEMGRQIHVNPSLEADEIVLVDTSSLEHLGPQLCGRIAGRKVIMIDHHRPVPDMRKHTSLCFIDEESTSEAELMLDLLELMGVKPTPDQATLLLAGILTDTADLRLARNKTFENIVRLIKLGADYKKALEITKHPEDISRRIAMIKAAKRAEMQEIRGYLVLFSKVGSFEADAAVALLKLGADLAFVGSENGERIKISARARPGVCDKTRLHLGDLMIQLANCFNGTGGGHPGAASFTGEVPFEEAKGWLINKLFEHLLPKQA